MQGATANAKLIHIVGNYGGWLNFNLLWGRCLSEAVLDGCKDVAVADLEGVFGAGEDAVCHILVLPLVEQIVDSQRQADLAADVPGR